MTYNCSYSYISRNYKSNMFALIKFLFSMFFVLHIHMFLQVYLYIVHMYLNTYLLCIIYYRHIRSKGRLPGCGDSGGGD